MEQQNQQFIQEKTESKPPLKTNWKYIAIVVALSLVVGVGAIVLSRVISPAPIEPTPAMVQQTPAPSPQPQSQTFHTSTPALSEVEGWQTYRNDEFGFEVRYPKEWTILEYSSQSVEFHHPNNNPYISLVVFENIGSSGDQSVQGITFCEAYPDQCTMEKFSVGGVQTVIEWRLHDAGINVNLPDKSHTIAISFNSSFDEITFEEMNLFREILSTFRFVDF